MMVRSGKKSENEKSGEPVVLVFESRQIGMACYKSAQDLVFRAGPRVKSVDIPGEAHTKGVEVGWEIICIEKSTFMDNSNPTAPWMDPIYVKDKNASEIAALVRIASRPIRLTFKTTTDCIKGPSAGAPDANTLPSTYSAHEHSESDIVATENDEKLHNQVIDPHRSQETRTDAAAQGEQQQLLKGQRKPASAAPVVPRGDHANVHKSSQRSLSPKDDGKLVPAGSAHPAPTDRACAAQVQKRRTHRFRKNRYRHEQEGLRTHGKLKAGTSDLPLNAQTPPATEEPRRLDQIETGNVHVQITCGRCHSAFHLATANDQHRHQSASLQGKHSIDFKHWLCPMCTVSLLKAPRDITQTTEANRAMQHEPETLFRQNVGATYDGLNVRSYEQNQVQRLLAKIESLHVCLREHRTSPMHGDMMAATFDTSIHILTDEMRSLALIPQGESHFETVVDLLGVYFSSLGDVIMKAYSYLNATNGKDDVGTNPVAADDTARGKEGHVMNATTETTRDDTNDDDGTNGSSVHFHLSNFVHSLLDVFLKGSGVVLGMVPNALSVFLAAEKQSVGMKAIVTQHRRTKFADNADGGDHDDHGVLFQASRDFHEELLGKHDFEEDDDEKEERIGNMTWDDIRNLIPDDDDGHTPSVSRANIGPHRITSTSSVPTLLSNVTKADVPYWCGLRERTGRSLDSQGCDTSMKDGVRRNGHADLTLKTASLPQQKRQRRDVAPTAAAAAAAKIGKDTDSGDMQQKSLEENVAFVNRVSFEQSRIVRTMLCRLAKTDTLDAFPTTIIFRNIINAIERLQDRLETVHDFLDVKLLADIESSAWLLQIYELCSLALTRSVQDPRTSASARLRIDTLFRQHMKLYRRCVSTTLHTEAYNLGVLAVLQRITAHILYAQT